MSGLLDFVGSPHGGGHMLLPEWNSQTLLTGPLAIIDHSQVGSTNGTYLLFRDLSNLESHFSVRGRRSGTRDGRIEQFMSIDREAHANLDANRYGISVETEDDGDPNNQLWTEAQLESLIWLHERLRQLRPTIPRRRSRSCGDPAGLGCHTLHGAPSCWTPVVKTCPGRPARFRQWEDVLLPAFLGGDVPLTDTDKVFMRELRDEGVRMTAMGDPRGLSNREVNNIARVLADLTSLRGAVGALSDDEANILAVLAGSESRVLTAVAAIQAGDPGPLVEEIRKLPDAVRARFFDALQV